MNSDGRDMNTGSTFNEVSVGNKLSHHAGKTIFVMKWQTVGWLRFTVHDDRTYIQHGGMKHGKLAKCWELKPHFFFLVTYSKWGQKRYTKEWTDKQNETRHTQTCDNCDTDWSDTAASEWAPMPGRGKKGILLGVVRGQVLWTQWWQSLHLQHCKKITS